MALLVASAGTIVASKGLIENGIKRGFVVRTHKSERNGAIGAWVGPEALLQDFIDYVDVGRPRARFSGAGHADTGMQGVMVLGDGTVFGVSHGQQSFQIEVPNGAIAVGAGADMALMCMALGLDAFQAYTFVGTRHVLVSPEVTIVRTDAAIEAVEAAEKRRREEADKAALPQSAPEPEYVEAEEFRPVPVPDAIATIVPHRKAKTKRL